MTRRLLQTSWVCHPERSRHAAARMPSVQKALVLIACELPARAIVPQAQRQHAHEGAHVGFVCRIPLCVPPGTARQHDTPCGQLRGRL